MARNSGNVEIVIEVDSTGTVKIGELRKDLDQVDGSLKQVKSSGRGAGSSIDDVAVKSKRAGKNLDGMNQRAMASHASLFKLAGVTVALGVLANAIQNIGGKSIQAASALEEINNKFTVVFKGQQDIANAWTKVLVDAYLMSERSAKAALASFQDLLVPFGVMPGLAAEMSNKFVKLSADLASFNDVSPDEVLLAMKSAILGQYEPISRFGAALTASTVAAKALSMGLADNAKELTHAHKAQAALAMITEASAAAIGDVERSIDSYANQSKKAEANTEDLAAAFGDGLLPIATLLKKSFNEWVASIDDLDKKLTAFTTETVAKSLDFFTKAAGVLEFYIKYWSILKNAIVTVGKVWVSVFNGIKAAIDFVTPAFKKIASAVKWMASLKLSIGSVYKETERVNKGGLLGELTKDIEGVDSTFDTIIGKLEGFKSGLVEAGKAGEDTFGVLHDGADAEAEKLQKVSEALKKKIAAEKLAEAQRLTLVGKYRKDLEILRMSSHEKAVDLLEKERDKIIDTTKDAALAWEIYHEKLAKLNEKETDARIKAIEEAEEYLETYHMNSRELAIRELEKERDAFIRLTGEKELAWETFEAKKIALETKTSEEIEAINKKTVNNISQEWSTNIERMFANGIPSAKDFFGSVWDMFKDMLIKMAAQNISKAIFGGKSGGGLFSGLLGGLFGGNDEGGGFFSSVLGGLFGGSDNDGGGIIGSIVSGIGGIFDSDDGSGILGSVETGISNILGGGGDGNSRGIIDSVVGDILGAGSGSDGSSGGSGGGIIDKAMNTAMKKILTTGKDLLMGDTTLAEVGQDITSFLSENGNMQEIFKNVADALDVDFTQIKEVISKVTDIDLSQVGEFISDTFNIDLGQVKDTITQALDIDLSQLGQNITDVVNNVWSGGAETSSYNFGADMYAYEAPPGGQMATAAGGAVMQSGLTGGLIISEAAGMSGIGAGGITAANLPGMGGGMAGSAAGAGAGAGATIASIATYAVPIIAAATMIYSGLSGRSARRDAPRFSGTYGLEGGDDSVLGVTEGDFEARGKMKDAELAQWKASLDVEYASTVSLINDATSHLSTEAQAVIDEKMGLITSGQHQVRTEWSALNEDADEGAQWNVNLSTAGQEAYQSWLTEQKKAYEKTQQSEYNMYGSRGGSMIDPYGTGAMNYGNFDPTSAGANISAGQDTNWLGIGGVLTQEEIATFSEETPLTAGLSPNAALQQKYEGSTDAMMAYLGEDFAGPFIENLQEQIFGAGTWETLGEEAQKALLPMLNMEDFLATPYEEWLGKLDQAMAANAETISALSTVETNAADARQAVADVEQATMDDIVTGTETMTEASTEFSDGVEAVAGAATDNGEAAIEAAQATGELTNEMQAVSVVAEEASTGLTMMDEALAQTVAEVDNRIEELRAQGQAISEEQQKAIQEEAKAETASQLRQPAFEEIDKGIEAMTVEVSPIAQAIQTITDQTDTWEEALKELRISGEQNVEVEQKLNEVRAAGSQAVAQLINAEAASIESGLDQNIMGRLEPTQLMIMNIASEFKNTVQRVQELEAVSGKAFDHLYKKAKRWQILQIDDAIEAQKAQIAQMGGSSGGGGIGGLADLAGAAGGVSSAVNDLTGAVKDFSGLISSLEGVIESIDSQILGMQISTVNPQNERERMAILQQEIADFGTPTTPEGIAELQRLYKEQMSLAGEIWQRPSEKYGEVYDSTVDALRDLKDQASEMKTDYELQQRQVEIAEATNTYLSKTSFGLDQETLATARQQLRELETQKMLLEVDWGNMSGDAQGVMDLLSQAVGVFGWGSEITLDFVANMGANFQGTSPDDYIKMLDLVQDASGGYQSQASITLMAEYVNTHGLPLDTMMAFLGAQGLDDTVLAEIRGRLDVAVVDTASTQILNATIGDLAGAMQDLTAEYQGAEYEVSMGQLLLSIWVETNRTANNTAALNQALDNVPSFSGGGVVYEPTLAMIGDAPTGPELVVPIQGGGVPVVWSNGGSGPPRRSDGGGATIKMHLEVTVNESGDPKQTAETIVGTVTESFRHGTLREELKSISRGH